MTDLLRRLYIRFLRPHVRDGLSQQRFKLFYFAWGYYRLLLMPKGLHLLRRFLSVDWNILHAHRPSEIAVIARAMNAANPHEIVIEAGCYNGGSTAKLSILSKMFGYKLHVYDSFEGVEPMTDDEKHGTYDFSGEYAASEALVKQNVGRYGEISVCTFHKGWFADTLANGIDKPIRVAYIDCDVAKGTKDALKGIVKSLAPNGIVFSQDFHLRPVRNVLESRDTWPAEPSIVFHTGNLASVRLRKPETVGETVWHPAFNQKGGQA